MPFLCSPLSLTPKLLQALPLLPPLPQPRCCLLKGAKVSTAAVAPPRSHPATVPRQGMAQRADNASRGAESSHEPLRHLPPPPRSQVFPWGCFGLLAPRRKWHLTTPKLEMGKLGFTWVPQHIGVHSSPGEMWGTQACIQWARWLCQVPTG